MAESSLLSYRDKILKYRMKLFYDSFMIMKYRGADQTAETQTGQLFCCKHETSSDFVPTRTYKKFLNSSPLLFGPLFLTVFNKSFDVCLYVCVKAFRPSLQFFQS